MIATCSRGLVHQPARPCRNGVPGEVVFLSRWQMLMLAPLGDEDAHPLQEILGDVVDRVEQRDATLAASFMTWLGTNVGGAMIYESCQIRGVPYPVLAAWSNHNMRRRHINLGIRTLQSLLVSADAPLHPITKDPLRPPRVSVRDLEVAEALAVWLGWPAGQAYIAACQVEMAAVREHEQMLWRSANQLGLRPYISMTLEQTLAFLALIRRHAAAAA